MNLPYCKFFYRDWLADLQLRQCSPSTRAIWADMLCLMGLNDGHYGYLEAKNGAPLPEDEIARMTCNRLKAVKSAIMELEEAGIFSRDDQGVIYSRRMVKDREKHNAKSKAADARWRGRELATTAVAGSAAYAPAYAHASAEADASASPNAHAQRPNFRDQTEGEETGRTPTDRKYSMPDNWQLTAAFEALRQTGKFTSLTPELLAMVDRNYPRARLSDNYTELVEAARSLPGAIGEPHGWLNKKASQIEVRLQRRETIKFPAPHRSRMVDTRPELRATERMVIL